VVVPDTVTAALSGFVAAGLVTLVVTAGGVTTVGTAGVVTAGEVTAGVVVVTPGAVTVVLIDGTVTEGAVAEMVAAGVDTVRSAGADATAGTRATKYPATARTPKGTRIQRFTGESGKTI
jgi:hypothetical protein